MQTYNNKTRTHTDKISSFSYNPQYTQRGLIASKINAAYTFIPCEIKLPESLSLTPVSKSTSANGVALFTTTVGWEVVSFDTLSAVTNLDAHDAAIAYIPGNLVKATLTGGTEKAYICVEGHTSTAGPDFDTDYDAGYWQELDVTTFIKITHTAAGGTKNMVAHYVISGEDTGL